MVVTDSFTATGVGTNFKPTTKIGQSLSTDYNISIAGTFVATLELQKSYDGGTTFNAVKEYTSIIEELGTEPESGVVYRFECTAFTSGQADTRLGTN